MRTGGGRFTPAGLQVPRVLTEASFRRHLTSYRRACSQSVAKFALAGGIAHAPDLRHAPRAVTKPPSITHDRPGRPSGSADLPFTLALAIALAAAYLVLAWISTRLVPHVSEIGYLWPAGGLATGVSRRSSGVRRSGKIGSSARSASAAPRTLRGIICHRTRDSRSTPTSPA